MKIEASKAEETAREAEDFREVFADDRESTADDAAEYGADEGGMPAPGGYGFSIDPVYFALGFMIGGLLTLALECLFKI